MHYMYDSWQDPQELRPKVMAVPGLFTFMQNPPPITVSGQNSASVYQLTLDVGGSFAICLKSASTRPGLVGL
jgi:hypothetical protein